MPDPREEDDDLETRMSGPGAPAPDSDEGETMASVPARPAGAPGARRPDAGDEPETGEVAPAAALAPTPARSPTAPPPPAPVVPAPDMESIPRRAPLPARRPAGESLPGLSRPPSRTGLPLPPGVSRPAGRRAPEPEPDTSEAAETELPTSEIRGERGVGTQAGSDVSADAGSAVGGAGRPARPAADETIPEDATVVDEGLTERQKAMLEAQASAASPGTPAGTVGDVGGASATPRSQGPVPASKFSRGTARDPIAGTAAHRSASAGHHGPTHLREGMLLADRYELVRRLGKGGMGEVWQARHTLLQGMRAIKVIKAAISRDASFRARFLSEGQTMMRVKHPGVVEVTDLDETRQNRELFMVMEYLEGRTVHEAVRSETAPLRDDVRNVARIFRDLAHGMQRIHDERIVHKDLKTDNVLLVTGEDGLEHPKVIDFGLAKRLGEPGDVPAEVGAKSEGVPTGETDTRTTLSGTLAYMAPEQFLGEPSSFQSDIYAFGVMLFECFSKGEYPMPRGSLGDYLKRHKEGVVPRRVRQARPELDPFVAELADRCMAPVREQRPQSFREIAAQLDWWLDIPVRAARRKRIALFASSAAVLFAAAVYGFFFTKAVAAVVDVNLVRSGGEPLALDSARRFHLPDACLAAIDVSATVNGDAGEPSLVVDGARRDAALTIERVDGRAKLTGTLDLSDLPDGEHVLGFRAASGADPSPVKVVVDRKAPVVTAVTLPGDDASGITNADNPGLWIRVDTTQTALSAVEAYIPAAQRRVPAQRDPADAMRWNVTGVHEADGEQVVLVSAVDIAGNRSEPREFRFVRDTSPPAAIGVKGLLAGRMPVRTSEGNVVVVTSAEPVRLRVEFVPAGERVGTVIERAAATQFDVPLPAVPPQGGRVAVVAIDDAGNESRLEDGATTFPVEIRRDVVTIAGPKGESRWAPRAGERAVLRVRRTYPLPPDFRVRRARVLAADGSAAPGEPEDVDGAQVEPASATEAVVTLPASLPPGEFGLSITGALDATVESSTLVVDDARPELGTIELADAKGERLDADSWSTTRDLRATVEVADLSLASLTLAGAAPSERLAPGRRRYTFDVRLEREGESSLLLVAKDEAENETRRFVRVRADWTVPAISLTAPAAGAKLDDVKNAVFSGTCSEDAYALVVERDGRELSRVDHRRAAFDDPVRLEAGEYELVVHAEDLAKQRSAPVRVRVAVAHVETELPDLWTWTRGVPSEMRKVAPGAVVVEGRTLPVGRVFLDLSEVTNRKYRSFLDACAEHAGRKTPWDHPDQPAAWSHVPPAETWGDPRWNADDLPVVNVAWWDAWAFAKWTGRRLPSEAEWVKAAAQKDGELELRSWPPLAAGDAWKDGLLATAEATQQKGPVDATRGADVSPSGCLHMGGNVSEWVDLPFARPGEPKTGVRGGSFWTTRFGADVRRVPVKPYEPGFRLRTIGFRCAVDASEVRP